jgi:hypothetical protein
MAPHARLAVVLAALLVLALTLAAEAGAANRFTPAPNAPISRTKLFDLGTADYDADGNLDLFTTAHKFHGALLRNDGLGSFSDVLGENGLAPTPAFPGLEYLRKPVITKRGVYLWATDALKEGLPGVLHMRTSVAAEGRLTFDSKGVQVVRSDGAVVKTGKTPEGRSTADFTVVPGGDFELRAGHIDVPIEVSFKLPEDPGIIRVGTDAVPATKRDFLLTLRDRHGFAFADLAGGPSPDIFAISGGLGGAIKLPNFEGVVQDELLVDQGTQFTNLSPGSGLLKGGCRGRQTAAVDINGDGLLDLFETCEGDPPNVYLHRGERSFEEIDPPNAKGTTYRWVNLTNGRRPQLLAAQRNGIHIYQLHGTRWQLKQKVADDAGKGGVVQLAVADLEGDGDLDVLAVSRGGNTLYRNKAGRLHPIGLKRRGIPPRSVAASFVDFDNDGLMDLDLVPQGVLHRDNGGVFRETHMLRTPVVGAAITDWFDYDNDGLRDPVIVTGPSEFAPKMLVTRRHNAGGGGHWAEFDLHGLAGNREAIGARVALKAGKRWQYQWVGQNDDSHHSQGHYRLYFGLGKVSRIRQLRVFWPDGAVTRLHGLDADQLRTLEHP